MGIELGVIGDTYYRVILPGIGLPVHTTLRATCEGACKLLRRLVFDN
ncbi:MAG: hypothetical protein WCS37_18635 [Chloroflexota bacterium]|nr:hypothetical protein [Chloroflexota bacterium]